MSELELDIGAKTLNMKFDENPVAFTFGRGDRLTVEKKMLNMYIDTLN